MARLVRAHDQPMTIDIASSSNERIKAAVRLRDRSERDETGLTIVDGVREIDRALDARVRIETAYVCEPLLSPTGIALVDRLRGVDASVLLTSEPAFRKVAFGDRVEGVVAVIHQPPHELADLALPDEPLLVVLEGVEKPGNLGAILRSADASGADALIAADPRTDLFNPNAIRASTGTVFAVPVAAAGSADVRAFLDDRSIRVVAAKPDAALDYTAVDMTGPVAILLGSEAQGLTEAWSKPDVSAVRLPMAGIADSLNVSTAAAILLYEARRQRQS
jgi:TrmH family RNA methyltransferase